MDPRCAEHQCVCTSGLDHYDNASELPEVMRHQDIVWLNVNFKLTFDNVLIWFHVLGEQMIKASQTLIPSAFWCKHRGRSIFHLISEFKSVSLLGANLSYHLKNQTRINDNLSWACVSLKTA